jgi:drug/metabolite transporter (DMT)-like permease
VAAEVPRSPAELAEPAAGRASRTALLEGTLALVGVQLCFGLFPIFGTWAFAGFTPLAVAAWRMLVAGGVLGAAAFAIHGRGAWPRRGDWPRLFACSMLGVTLNMVLYLEGLERSTALSSGLIMPVIPVFTLLIAVLLRQERFAPVRALGILVALSGSLWLALGRGGEVSAAHRTGNLLMLINAFCYSLYLVLSRPLLGRMPALVVVAWVFLLSCITVPLFAWSTPLWPAASARSWGSLAFILVFPTVLAYLLNVYALARVSASTTAAFIYLQSLITSVAAMLLLDERLTARTLLCGALIFAGTGLVLRRAPVRVAPPRPAQGCPAKD